MEIGEQYMIHTNDITGNIITYSCGHKVSLPGFYSTSQISELQNKKCLKCSIKEINFVKFSAVQQATMEIGLSILPEQIGQKEIECYWGKVYKSDNVPPKFENELLNLLTLLLEDTDEYKIEDIGKFLLAGESAEQSINLLKII